MGVVTDFIRKLKVLEESINLSLQQSVDSNKNVLIDQQTDEQFDKGKDSFNISIVPSYALSTKKIKRSKGQPTNRVTLKDTGELYNAIDIQTTKTNMVISANVEHFKYLVAHYPNNQLLGIQDKAMRGFIRKYTYPVIRANFDKIINR